MTMVEWKVYWMCSSVVVIREWCGIRAVHVATVRHS